MDKKRSCYLAILLIVILIFSCERPGTSINPQEMDTDGDGVVDSNDKCEEGQSRECGTDVGECQKGTENCEDGRWSGNCEGAIAPADEIDDGVDNDCDGEIDEVEGEDPCEICVSDNIPVCGRDIDCVCGNCEDVCGQCSVDDDYSDNLFTDLFPTYYSNTDNFWSFANNGSNLVIIGSGGNVYQRSEHYRYGDGREIYDWHFSGRPEVLQQIPSGVITGISWGIERYDPRCARIGYRYIYDPSGELGNVIFYDYINSTVNGEIGNNYNCEIQTLPGEYEADPEKDIDLWHKVENKNYFIS